MCPGCLFAEFLSITFFFLFFSDYYSCTFPPLVFLPRYVTWNEEERGRTKKVFSFLLFIIHTEEKIYYYQLLKLEQCNIFRICMKREYVLFALLLLLVLLHIRFIQVQVLLQILQNEKKNVPKQWKDGRPNGISWNGIFKKIIVC